MSHSLLHTILSKVATSNLQDFDSARVAFSGLRSFQFGNPEAIHLRDGMLNLAFSVDDRGLVHNHPSFTHEFVDRMYHMITREIFSGHWASKT
ncbi:unnamed protein product [Eruca vesicaria subsp. sativa]|uniref:Uncharacterized protein n=1 Tax=Eruca vesicaria subsp. sativa TaxID=29727 RepID=A0ABC8MAK7_ERUVS|nr:unnamed protein product [Eruca vesicaria subsp. sativa]